MPNPAMLQKISRTLVAASAMLALPLAAITPAELPQNLGPNLALNKPYESSDKNASGWDPGLTDGSWNAAKFNTYASGREKLPKTVTIDLESSPQVAAILVGTPHFGSTKTVVVSLSANGNQFTEVGTHDFAAKKAGSHLFQFQPAKARYVRLTFTGNHEKQDQFATEYCFITEVEVFGATGGPTQSNLGKSGPATPGLPPVNAKLELPRARLPQNLGPNLALAKPHKCDDKNPSAWDAGLTDGLWAMRRGSTFATNRTDKFPKNVTIDLRTSARLTHIHVGVPDFGSTKTIAVSVSYDGRTFTEVGRHDFPFGKAEARLFEFAPVLARQVRLTYLGNHAENNRFDPAYCFTTEVEVYAKQ
ncbi:MAG: discoidin domain-containing protein [Kiritimatiellaeota bacterium]|nr:discoidin domain-containing protein [Kiritimatiellota bacterium]